MSNTAGNSIAGTGADAGANANANPAAPAPIVTAAAFPSPSDRKAPKFKGKHVKDFIQEIELLAALHSVPLTDLPKACVRYMSKKVKQIISAEGAFQGVDWALACARLRALFGSASGVHRCSPSKLRKFVDEWQRENPINSEETLDDYWREFLWHLGTMVTDGRMTENERNLLFFSGLPKRLRRAILPALEVACRARNVVFSRESPATLDESITAARSHLKAIAVNAISDSESEDSGHSRSRHRHKGKYKASSKRSSSSRSSSSSSDSDSDSDSSDSDSDSESDNDHSSRRRASKKTRSKSLSRKKKLRKSHSRMDSHSDSDLSTLRRDMEKRFKILQHDLRSQAAIMSQPAQPSQPSVSFPTSVGAPAHFPHSVPQPHHFTHHVPPQGAYQFPPYGQVAAGSSSMQQNAPPIAGPSYPYRPPIASLPTNPSGPRRCHMCGGCEGIDLKHPLGLRFCPDVLYLTEKGTLHFNPVNGRLGYVNGPDLPPYTLYPSGWRVLFPALQNPSQMGGQPASCASLEVYYDDKPLSCSYSSDAGSSFAFPVLTRSQAKARPDTGKNVRFEDEVGDIRDPPPGGPVQPKDSSTVDPVSRSAPPSNTAPPPAINTEKGWRREQRDKRTPSVEDDKEDDNQPPPARPQHPTRVPPRSSGVKFTSEIQDSVSFDSVQDELLGTKVTLTLREVVAIAPSLQKQIANLVKTRREFDHKPASIHAGTAAVDIISLESPATQAASSQPSITLTSDRILPENTVRQLAELVAETSTDGVLEAEISFVQGREQLADLLERYAASIALGHPRKVAMISGYVTVIFGDQRAIFLVDSGSELNIVNYSLWKRTSLKMDPDGARWSLRGIGGQFVTLLGCVLDAPVQVNGRNFDHHFFISTSPGSSQHEGILGQPWLSHFSAQISYAQGGDVELTVYSTGAKSGPSVSLTIASANHPRNVESVVMAQTPCKLDF
ncbi:hypothetical protein GSI_08629 [Ganoderma sinense ZZ0214-1]|uniref:Peptidase A2 domain-containing protein n=1 Tax=Ganoderma sinense ZZ0214-1 TaxID=1077348 RepID=A0A2G8S4U6_9APHY|nr:hypothetical protein GSI_08629 [Ganoderma sinense ZZ0214-1]